MFEFIGILVVAWFGFVIIKSSINGGIKGTLMRASVIAMDKGVPRDFALATISDPNRLIKSRKALVKENAELRELKVYEQYAAAIIMSYRIGSQAVNNSDVSIDAIEKKIKSFIAPQVKILDSEGLPIHINQITYVYIGALAICMGRIDTDATELKGIISNIFNDEKYKFPIENSYRAAVSKDFWDKLKLMIPVAKAEVAAGHGDYFVKYTRKALSEIDEMFKEDIDFDPRNQPLNGFLDV